MRRKAILGERLRFGPFELDPAAGELRRSGARVRLQPQPLKVLACLARRAGQVVDRETLRSEIWGDGTHVDFDRGLNFAVLRIRAALGDDAEAPRYVQTLPRRGYRFLAPVEVASAARPPAPARRPSRRWPLAAGFAAALVAGWTAVTPGDSAPAGSRELLAVIPFAALEGAAPELADGLTEEVITRLGRLHPRRLGVIGRRSVDRYRDGVSTLAEVQRELGVDYVLEGSVRRGDGPARIAARLVDARSGGQLWSDSFETADGDAIAVQVAIAGRVTDALARSLFGSAIESPAPPRVAPGPASEAYRTARSVLRRGGSGALARAAGFLETAVELDPQSAVAWAALADVRHRLRLVHVTPELDAARAARDAAERALALDPDLAEAHHARALVALWHDWDLEAAARSLERALLLDPGSARAHHDEAWRLLAVGRPGAAVTAIQRAQRLDPVAPQANCDVGWVLLRARRYGEAQAACRRALDIEPGHPQAESCLASAALRLGRPGLAVPRLLQSMEEGGAPSERVSPLGALPPLEAVRAVREWRLERLRERARPGFTDYYHIAVEQAALGRLEEALASLERGYDERVPAMVVTDADPEFDALRADPRFGDLVRRIATTHPVSGRHGAPEDQRGTTVR